MGSRLATDQVKWTTALLLALVLVGCAITAREPSTVAAATIAVPSPMSRAIHGNSGDYLVVGRTDLPPTIDGQVEDVWAAAELLRVPLTRGPDGTEHALDVELRALQSGQAIYFLAQWLAEAPYGEENVVFNTLTLHWRIPEPMTQGLSCTVVCHTAFADGHGRFVYANAETIPQGGNEALAASGSWEAGRWTLEWSRPLHSDNPFDLQFSDLKQAYPFLVKIFERTEGVADPVSERQLLVFEP